MLIFNGRDHDLGGGMLVRRILPHMKKRMVGPFVFLDHLGPVAIAPGQNTDVRPHPHIGLSTLTYLFEGRLVHHDSLDRRATIMPGQVNWMTAGKGISHSERAHPEDHQRARTLHGLQFWVALPDGSEDVPPSFQHYESVPRREGPAFDVAVVAGEAFGLRGPVHVTSPMVFVEFHMKISTEISLTEMASANPTELAGYELALYVIRGGLEVNGARVAQHQIAYFDVGEFSGGFSGGLLHAESGTHFVLIGGEAFKTPRHIWWNLVSSSREKIEETKRAWREGTFPMVPGETEFIPLPEES